MRIARQRHTLPLIEVLNDPHLRPHRQLPMGNCAGGSKGEDSHQAEKGGPSDASRDAGYTNTDVAASATVHKKHLSGGISCQETPLFGCMDPNGERYKANFKTCLEGCCVINVRLAT
jgi:hypothetical protein